MERYQWTSSGENRGAILRRARPIFACLPPPISPALPSHFAPVMALPIMPRMRFLVLFTTSQQMSSKRVFRITALVPRQPRSFPFHVPSLGLQRCPIRPGKTPLDYSPLQVGQGGAVFRLLVRRSGYTGRRNSLRAFSSKIAFFSSSGIAMFSIDSIVCRVYRSPNWLS